MQLNWPVRANMSLILSLLFNGFVVLYCLAVVILVRPGHADIFYSISSVFSVGVVSNMQD